MIYIYIYQHETIQKPKSENNIDIVWMGMHRDAFIINMHFICDAGFNEGA